MATNASANYAEVKLTHINPLKSESQWTRVKQFTPMYPMELAMKGIAGCGVFKVTVDEKGKTDKVELVSSVPKKVIFKPSKKVIKKWKWKNVTGLTNASEEKLLRLDFCMGGKTEAEAKMRCEEQSKMSCGTSEGII
jgi:hypothetical protein